MKLEKAEVLEKTVDFIQRTKLGNKNQKGMFVITNIILQD